MSKELTERLDRCNLNAIIFNQREALRTLEEDKATLKKQNKKLQEQLKEANDTILGMIGAGSYKADEMGNLYLKKWGVK